MIRFLIGMTLTVALLAPGAAFAIEVAPRISDREIIEKLAEIQSEFKVIHERFEAVDAEFRAVRNEIRQLDKRLEQVWALMLIVIAGIMALIGFVIWDRKTAMRPIEQEVQLLRQDLDAQRHANGNATPASLLRVLREAAQGSPPLASALKNASLL